MVCFKPFKIAIKAYRNKWMIENNGGKVKKETLAHWMDLAINRILSNSNIIVDFKGIGIWPLNLDRM